MKFEPEKMTDAKEIEKVLYSASPKVLEILLKDRTTGLNIIWATDSYVDQSKEYHPESQILFDQVKDKKNRIIVPRSLKKKEEQAARTKTKAEVFTPSWIVKKMIKEADKSTNTRSGKGYVTRPVIEITCGEAPFLVSRYDPETGKYIPTEERYGLLDLKLKEAKKIAGNENTWNRLAFSALRSTYGYEFQGDSLLLARENILFTFVEYVIEFWGHGPTLRQMKTAAEIISWNIFQADGLTKSVPYKVVPLLEPEPLALFSFLEDSGTYEPYTPSVNSALGTEDIQYECRLTDWSKKNGKRQEYKFSNMRNNEGEIMKKFSVCIGNPPFQDENELSTRKPPVYHKLMDSAMDLADVVELITPARFLFNAGQTPKEWNRERLNDEHFKVLEYYPDAETVFPTTDIKGGVAITYRDKEKIIGPIGAFTAFSELNGILARVIEKNEKTAFLDSIVSSQGIYHYSENAFKADPNLILLQGKGTGDKIISKSFSKASAIFFDSKPNDDDEYIEMIGLSDKTRKYRYIKRKNIKENEWLNSYNVFVPEANGSGALGEVLSTPLIGQPLIGHTDTFLSIGKLDNEEEANALLKYIKSKFARTMLGVKKATQHNPRSTWEYVPLQDFTTDSDIDWSKSIPEIDQQLYQKYDLSPEEISFIETHVKEMS